MFRFVLTCLFVDYRRSTKDGRHKKDTSHSLLLFLLPSIEISKSLLVLLLLDLLAEYYGILLSSQMEASLITDSIVFFSLSLEV